ncbi:type II secretion system protein J [Rhodoferax sp.]|uniref:PulJ/GspJ family protein n=1 Tax=Rhodoferax sp. TaxID=50421 RepID=UPI00374C8B19
MQRQRGFTLVELLVALMVMALMAVLSWRGLDGMTRAQSQTQQRADEILTLQAGLSQWTADLDALQSLAGATALDWDGRGLRLTRRSSDPNATGPLVVAWSRRELNGTDQWLRWQSPQVHNRAELAQAWARAALWAQNPGDAEKRDETALTPLADWQLFYYREGAWSNPLSSSSTTAATVGSTVDTSVPDGIRLVLTLPPGQALSGVLTHDWIRPIVGGGKS